MLTKSQLEQYELLRVSELSSCLSPTEIQRVTYSNRVDEIYQDMLATYKQNKIIICPGTLIVAQFQDLKYLIDGQHRFQALTKLLEETKFDQTIMVNTIQVASMNELNALFNRINNTVPVAEIPLGISRKDCNKVLKYFIDKYGGKNGIFSTCQTGNARRPHIHVTSFETHISKLLELYPTDLQERLETSNNTLKTRNAEYFKVKKTDTLAKLNEYISKATQKGGLYFGVFPNFECFNGLYDRHFIRSRTKIPKMLRDKIWKMYFGSKDTGICPWCNSELTVTNCHLAHDLAHAQGGAETIDNLYPCCALCNLSTGTKSYDEVVAFLKSGKL